MNRYLPEGSLIGTHENKEFLSSLRGLEKAFITGRILEGIATVCTEELALKIDLCGIKGVIPKSEALYSENGIKDIAVITRVGKPVCFKITSITQDPSGKPLVILSRREAQIECLKNSIKVMHPGDIIDAKVTHMEQFGAFVDIGCGIASLLSIDSISVSRISHPKDRFFVGMNIKTVVKSIDMDTGRINLSHKELLGTWEENVSGFQVGQTVAGKIRSIEDYGIFVELTPNLAGLAELRDDVKVGQSAAVYIKNIIPERMKVKLVMIDSTRIESPRTIYSPPEYYISEGHIDKWVYSPAICKKKVATYFN